MPENNAITIYMCNESNHIYVKKDCYKHYCISLVYIKNTNKIQQDPPANLLRL